MTVRILKSAITGIEDFPAQAAKHAVEMKEWRAHMARVKADEANPDIAAIDRHWPVRQPDPHPVIAAAVNEKDEMDYELVDDGPTPDQVLRAKKNKLIDLVGAAEHAAVDAILPRGRVRLYGMREDKIRKRDNALMVDLAGPATVAKTIKSVVGLGPKMKDLEAEAARQRPADDTLHLEQQQQRREAIEKIRERGAIAHSAIEDLTLETIDDYQLPDFTKD